MKVKAIAAVGILSAMAFAWTVSASQNPAAAKVATPQVTVPNGSSPAKANAPQAPMNNTESMRSGWNHGNGSLWVLLEKPAVINIDGPATTDENFYDLKGYSRVKFGWWRGVPGKFTIEGRRLDAPALPLRYQIQESAYGAFGFIPSYLYFPTAGYWEITGRLDNQTLTFVVHVKGG